MPILKRSPCIHVHLSGRQCGRSAPYSVPICGFHRGGKCAECDKMQEVFPIRKTVRDVYDGGV